MVAKPLVRAYQEVAADVGDTLKKIESEEVAHKDGNASKPLVEYAKSHGYMNGQEENFSDKPPNEGAVHRITKSLRCRKTSAEATSQRRLDLFNCHVGT